MKISRYAKSIVYMVFALIFVVLSTYFQVAMHRNGLEEIYFKTNAYIFITAIACIGTAVYSYRSYTKRHREHVRDSLFLFIVGLVLMTAAVLCIVNFGGIGDTFNAGGYTAANVNIVLMTVMPAPFFIRGLFLALSKREENRRLHGASLAFCAIVTAAYLLSVALGGMMRMVYYSGSASDISSVSEVDEEKSV